MSDYIYCGTLPPVGANGTQALLVGQFSAIWYPPPHNQPIAGERIWLVHGQPVPVLLGGGRIVITKAGYVLWNDEDLPGVRAAAIALGYRGPQGMNFLRLNNVESTVQPPLVTIRGINTGLNVATPQQIEMLTLLLPSPDQVGG